MRIRIEIDFNRALVYRLMGLLRRWRVLLILGFFGSVTAFAVPNSDPADFKAGEVIEANAVNGRFNALKSRIEALEATTKALGATGLVMEVNGATYSLGAIYRQTTDGKLDGNLLATLPPTAKSANGYHAAKLLCQNKLNSASAHMCSSEEMSRSAQLGVSISDKMGWISTGAGAGLFRDCRGWSSKGDQPPPVNDPNDSGVLWVGGGPVPGGCNEPHYIHCCD